MHASRICQWPCPKGSYSFFFTGNPFWVNDEALIFSRNMQQRWFVQSWQPEDGFRAKLLRPVFTRKLSKWWIGVGVCQKRCNFWESEATVYWVLKLLLHPSGNPKREQFESHFLLAYFDQKYDKLKKGFYRNRKISPPSNLETVFRNSSSSFCCCFHRRFPEIFLQTFLETTTIIDYSSGNAAKREEN